MTAPRVEVFQTDAAVIEQSWHEPEIFAQLYDRHAGPIHRYVSRRLGEALADDLVADTFLTAFQVRRRYDLDRPDARPWLYGIAANMIGRHRLAAGRARLLAATAGPDGARQNARRQLRPTRRWLLPSGLTAAAAAVAVILAVTLTGAPAASHPTATGSHPTETGTGITLVAKVLGTAARVVASEPVTEPSPGQWLYERSVTKSTGQGTQNNDEWITFDGTKSAYDNTGPSYYDPKRHVYVKAGQLIVDTQTGAPAIPPGTGALAAFDISITPLTAYNALAALPSSPQALLTAVDTELARAWAGQNYFGVTGTAKTKPQREFAWLGLLLWNAYAAAPPSALSAVYQAIATIPGVSVDQQVTDADGQSTIGITDDHGQTEILLSPTTYQPIGLIVRSPAVKVKLVGGVTQDSGPQTSSIAIVQVSEVSAPGKR
jgi:DNA-directed RNA polymerase specialized sigma24 family protein